MSRLMASWTITGRTVSTPDQPLEGHDETRVPWGQFTSNEEEERRLEQWQSLIDSRLIEWGRNPSVLEDDGVEAPTPHTIANACQLARMMRDDKLPPPTRVVPTVDGGVAFELETGDHLVCLEITPAGTLEYDRYFKSSLQDHMELPAIGHVFGR